MYEYTRFPKNRSQKEITQTTLLCTFCPPCTFYRSRVQRLTSTLTPLDTENKDKKVHWFSSSFRTSTLVFPNQRIKGHVYLSDKFIRQLSGCSFDPVEFRTLLPSPPILLDFHHVVWFYCPIKFRPWPIWDGLDKNRLSLKRVSLNTTPNTTKTPPRPALCNCVFPKL